MPLGSVAMSYFRFGFNCFWMAIPHGPSNIMATLPAPKFARFSFSPLERTPGTATLSLLIRSTYHWIAFTPAGLLKTALLVFSSITSPPA